MQRLLFEEAWDRTISQKDREEIERIFQDVVLNLDMGVTFTTVRIAVNHKVERLVTSIIHNRTEQTLIFENTILEIWVGDKRLAEHNFTYPTLQVPPKTSMPWTFIFPETVEVPTDQATFKLKKEK
ncbi:SLAP domain-containing protein [Fredinandcohnia sp. QZ13]|uniref:SLAP domain-containing protein n=1 Tax=Fredinandcohnia sp. QZ13 TaxID=3073144 RepID=UPI002853173C|nr:SLAP domain-containing protein [Fredinandcohnia sp. QZ13]MDR4889906.1 SLAP domain-containing protein [Fredinandcohnia sp. QZ13]